VASGSFAAFGGGACTARSTSSDVAAETDAITSPVTQLSDLLTGKAASPLTCGRVYRVERPALSGVYELAVDEQFLQPARRKSRESICAVKRFGQELTVCIVFEVTGITRDYRVNRSWGNEKDEPSKLAARSLRRPCGFRCSAPSRRAYRQTRQSGMAEAQPRL
jgi:hypothetical protein